MSNVCRYCRQHYEPGFGFHDGTKYCSSSCAYAAGDERKEKENENERRAKMARESSSYEAPYSNGSFVLMLLLSGVVWWLTVWKLLLLGFFPNHLFFFALLSLFLVPISIAAWCDRRQ
ncbi:hypothetical protein [Microcoleus sp. PH2017_28_MFU_U_A]|jgi:hypothetical protein|uniref:hypothetical protein n=1 Tax=Microcoleus sp. PH2017_28_MFU_U_A TaxID=2798838 RepID=UPI001D597ED0|nr:hypothetical protein [Microcoleus sp. PH2017_28_MFU_U_A]MCC3591190.1 hypothetical protein [Microcoleus sp. PH2017_28_MFU_U_A]